jgi:hypothetical protein
MQQRQTIAIGRMRGGRQWVSIERRYVLWNFVGFAPSSAGDEATTNAWEIQIIMTGADNNKQGTRKQRLKTTTARQKLKCLYIQVYVANRRMWRRL